MSLHPCKECGEQISSDAKVCPHCGRKQRVGVGVGCLSVLGMLILVGLVGSVFERNRGKTHQESVQQQTARPKLNPERAGNLIAIAKTQINHKDYVAASSTLKSVLRGVATASPQGVGATKLLKKIGPLATKQAQREARAERSQWELRNIARVTIQDRLLRMGYDVRVGNVVKPGSKDNRDLFIMGEPVNRVFAYNLITPDLRSRLRRLGFIKITFMKDRWDWVGEYDVATNSFRGLN
jgi:zinc-ribbon domain